MSIENRQTLETYEQHADTYVNADKQRLQRDPKHAQKKREKLKHWLQESLKGLPQDAQLFEFGSGDGSDIELFQELGYQITPSDAPKSFIKIMQQKGLSPIRFNVLEDEFPGSYDGIYSRRVIVHFTKEDTKQIFEKVFRALKPGGRYIFNALNSAGHNNLAEEWVDFDGDYAMGTKRYKKYWHEDELATLLQESGFVIRNMFPDGGDDDQRWFYVVAEKLEEKQ